MNFKDERKRQRTKERYKTPQSSEKETYTGILRHYLTKAQKSPKTCNASENFLVQAKYSRQERKVHTKEPSLIPKGRMKEDPISSNDTT